MRVHLKLDYDNCEPMPEWQMRSLLERAGYELVRMTCRVSPGGRGFHCKLEIMPPPESAAVTVALQAILGSDKYREAYNLGRIRHLSRVNEWWRNRWNVLYARTFKRKPKQEGGK